LGGEDIFVHKKRNEEWVISRGNKEDAGYRDESPLDLLKKWKTSLGRSLKDRKNEKNWRKDRP